MPPSARRNSHRGTRRSLPPCCVPKSQPIEEGEGQPMRRHYRSKGRNAAALLEECMLELLVAMKSLVHQTLKFTLTPQVFEKRIAHKIRIAEEPAGDAFAQHA